MSKPEFQKRILTIKDASIYLGQSSWCVAALIRTGRLPYIPKGRRRYLDIQDIDRWIERSKITDAAD